MTEATARKRRRDVAIVVAALLSLLLARPVHACVGLDCLNIYSTEPGGGELTVQWDYENRKVQTFPALPTCPGGTCLYSAIDPGFRAGSDPSAGQELLTEGTNVSLEIIAAASALRIRIDGAAVPVGGTVPLGTAPSLHNHPNWQLTVPEGETGDYPLSFKVKDPAGGYDDSQTFTILVTNEAPPTPAEATATPTPTPTATLVEGCPGDCNGDGQVRVDELVGGVNAVLGTGPLCPPLDLDGNGTAEVNEVVAAVNAALRGCSGGPTATPTVPASLAVIQDTIFSPRCAIPTCHDAATNSGNLNLVSGQSYAELVGVEPDIDTAREAGLLRVDAGDPENSFLLIKLEGPPPIWGSRMPLTGALLSEEEVALIRRWIAAGAPAE
jgi:hypothetical protein